jgi:hypothetical protein
MKDKQVKPDKISALNVDILNEVFSRSSMHFNSTMPNKSDTLMSDAMKLMSTGTLDKDTLKNSVNCFDAFEIRKKEIDGNKFNLSSNMFNVTTSNKNDKGNVDYKTRFKNLTRRLSETYLPNQK